MIVCVTMLIAFKPGTLGAVHFRKKRQVNQPDPNVRDDHNSQSILPWDGSDYICA